MSKAKSRKSTANQRQAQQRRQPAMNQAAQPKARASSSSQRPQTAAARPDQPQTRTSSVAQQRKQQQARSNQRKRVRSNWRPGVTVGVVLLVIAGIIAAFVFFSRQSNGTAAQATPVNSSVLQAVTHVDRAVLAAVGTGGATAPQPLRGQPPLKGPTGKPEIFYQGAEFCPYCAAQRWAVVVALSRFGTFGQLHETASAADDVYPNTSTFTFYNSTYTSSYIDFVPLEQYTNQKDNSGYYAVLQTPTTDQQRLISTYNGPPYTPQGGFPFMDVANQYLLLGPSFSPEVLIGL